MGDFESGPGGWWRARSRWMEAEGKERKVVMGGLEEYPVGPQWPFGLLVCVLWKQQIPQMQGVAGCRQEQQTAEAGVGARLEGKARALGQVRHTTQRSQEEEFDESMPGQSGPGCARCGVWDVV